MNGTFHEIVIGNWNQSLPLTSIGASWSRQALGATVPEMQRFQTFTMPTSLWSCFEGTKNLLDVGVQSSVCSMLLLYLQIVERSVIICHVSNVILVMTANVVSIRGRQISLRVHSLTVVFLMSHVRASNRCSRDISFIQCRHLPN